MPSVNTISEIDRVIIIPYNSTFSDNGRKPPFSIILWPSESQNLANVAQKQINSEQSPNKCTHQVSIGLREYFFLCWSETIIFGHFVATREPKSGQHGPKVNQF